MLMSSGSKNAVGYSTGYSNKFFRNLCFGSFLLSIAFLSNAQTCIQNLDSAVYFKYRNQQKAKFYANALLADLDSARCPTEIGIASTYNNLGLLLWEINEKSRGLAALKKGIAQELKVKDSTHRDLLGPYYNLATLYQETSNFSASLKLLVSW